ncbi:DUF2332 family protein [Streptomyces sp. CA-251387]|uniref:DUF2332 family protein n=1 Tax=Streptomyces sp. CA-251387 TaxID=3240064 RepID=UPI003D8A263E
MPAPDQPERTARLPAEKASPATAPPLLQGDAVKVLPDAFAGVPADAPPVVTMTWALSHVPLESRLRFLHRLDEAAAGRAVACVSAERAGVAPTRPTPSGRLCMPRPLAGRGWSQGRLLAWPADSWAVSLRIRPVQRSTAKRPRGRPR